MQMEVIYCFPGVRSFLQDVKQSSNQIESLFYVISLLKGFYSMSITISGIMDDHYKRKEIPFIVGVLVVFNNRRLEV